MKRKHYLLLALAMSTFSTTFSQIKEKNITNSRKNNFEESIVEGNVLMADSNAIENATVILKSDKKIVDAIQTDENGYFKFRRIKNGDYTLEVGLFGTDYQKRTFTLDEDHNAFTLLFFLNENKNALDRVVISSRKVNKFVDKNNGLYIARLPLRNLENPQAYSVVTKELMQDALVTNTTEALALAPGVTNIGESTGSGATGLSMRIRGFSTQINMRNGSSVAGLSLSDPQLTERVEVMKGPTGTLYGSNGGDGALVNRVTKKPFKKFAGTASYTGGSWDMQRATLDVNNPFLKDSSLMVRINTAIDRHRTFQDAGDSRSFLFAPSIRYIASPRLTFDMDIEYYNSSQNQTSYAINANLLNQGGLLYGKKADELTDHINYMRSYTSNDIKAEQRVYNVFLNAQYKISNSWTSNTFYSIGNADYRNRSLTLTLGAPTTGVTDLDSVRITRSIGYVPSNFSNTELQQNFVGDFLIGKFRNRMVVGLDYSYWYTNDNRVSRAAAIDGNNYFTLAQPEATYRSSTAISFQNYENLIATAPRSRINRRMNTYSAYVSDVFNVTDRLLAMASVRYDYFKPDSKGTFAVYSQGAWSPKLGLVYQIIKDQVSIYTNYLNGFSNNQPQTDPTTNASIDYKPTQTISKEIGVKFELFRGLLSSNISYYDMKKKDIIRNNPASTDANPLPSLQDDEIKSRGVDIEIIANPIPGLNITAGYSYNDNKYQITNSGKRVEFAPQNSGLLWASYRVTSNSAFDGFGFGFGGNYVSDYFMNATNTFTMPSYTIINSSFYYDKPRFRVSLKVNNVANKEYWVANGGNGNPIRPQNPRQFVAQVLFKF